MKTQWQTFRLEVSVSSNIVIVGDSLYIAAVNGLVMVTLREVVGANYPWMGH